MIFAIAVSYLIVSASEEAEKVDTQVDEVEVEVKGSDCSYFACIFSGRCSTHALYSLL